MNSPLVSSEVDLRDFAFMPLDVVRLRDSELAATVTGEEFRAAVLLWCASWHQVPAGSLPDDDIQLSSLAGYGRVVKEWLLHKAGALHGWLKCSDGRLYHPVISEKANEAWGEKLRHRWRRECDRVRKENKARKERGEPELPFPTEPRHLSSGKKEISSGNENSGSGIPAENPLKGQGQGQGQGNASSSFHSEEAVAAAADEKISKEEIERRCIQAAGFGEMSGIGKLAALVLSESDLETRVLPIIRDSARGLRASGRKPENWIYFVKAVSDPDRKALPPSASVSDPVGFYAAASSPQLEAWQEYRRRTEGRTFPTDPKGGWRFPTEFPPPPPDEMREAI